MDKILNLGTAIQIISNAVCLCSFNEAEGDSFYEANKKKIQRMKDYDILNLTETQMKNVYEFGQKFDDWAKWATENGYLKGYQQTAISDFYMTMVEFSKYNLSLNKNIAEHFFCYAIAKVLYNQLQEYRQMYPNETKQEATYWLLSNFEFFGDDEHYQTDYTPVASSFVLLSRWVKDINQLIKYWQTIIDTKGKRNKPSNIHNYIYKWKNGTTPSWDVIKLFYDNDLCPPEEYFIDDERIKKSAYKAFKQNLYLSFVITHLFDILEKEEILSEESRLMIRNGVRLYYRDFYVTRNQDNEEYSPNFEEEAKQNLMFKTLFVMLDGNLSQLPLKEYIVIIDKYPEFPKLVD